MNNLTQGRMTQKATKNNQAAMGASKAVTLKPSDYSDIGQAKVLIGQSGEWMRFSKATSWLVFDGMRWAESELDAQRIVQSLTDEQIEESRAYIANAAIMSAKAEESGNDFDRNAAKRAEQDAKDYHRFVIGRRKASAILSTLTAAAPHLQIKVEELDSDAFSLNVPAGTINLITGELRKHDPRDFCTKICTVSPNEDGKELFSNFLEQITSNDKELQLYLQQVAGMFAVGAVYRECLIIATGGGGNGKSTFFNLIAKVLGDYSGSMSSEVLTANCRKNKSPEYAELRGKRFIVAAELEEGMRLDTATVKKLCSTDRVQAEKKFRDPFSFDPSHSIVLYTNHLPRVGANDDGIWSRLVVVPFNARFRGTGKERLNYAEYLFNNAGGAVLSWIVAGARMFIANSFKIEMPTCVKDAIAEYRADNDWLAAFVAEKCETGSLYQQPSGDLYNQYGVFCDQNGEYKRPASDFKKAMTSAGYEYRRTKKGVFVYGIRTKKNAFIPTGECTPWDVAAT